MLSSICNKVFLIKILLLLHKWDVTMYIYSILHLHLDTNWSYCTRVFTFHTTFAPLHFREMENSPNYIYLKATLFTDTHEGPE